MCVPGIKIFVNVTIITTSLEIKGRFQSRSLGSSLANERSLVRILRRILDAIFFIKDSLDAVGRFLVIIYSIDVLPANLLYKWFGEEDFALIASKYNV